jgi:hypothetical protein
VVGGCPEISNAGAIRDALFHHGLARTAEAIHLSEGG